MERTRIDAGFRRSASCNGIRTPRLVSSRHRCDGPGRGLVSTKLGTPGANAILTTEMHGLPLLQVVAVAMLILANAFFVAAEFAMVSTRDTRIEQLLAAKVSGARAVRRLQHDLEYFLPAVQLGVTLCSLAIGWIGEPLAANMVLGWIDLLPQPPSHAQFYAHATAIAAVATARPKAIFACLAA